MKGFQARLLRAIAWAISKEGRHDLGAIVAAVTAAYTALHRGGVL